jgi:uncharacterized protein
MTTVHIDVPKQKIAEFCRKNRIRKLALFGSVLRDDFGPESDVDVLVEFDQGRGPGLLGIAGMELDLSEIVGRKVDLRTSAELSRYFRKEVVRQSRVLYVRE